MIKPLAVAVAIAAFAAPAMARDLLFSMQATDLCLAGKDEVGSQGCIGASARICMQKTVGGQTTVGMVGCLDAELGEWDVRLNEAYQKLMTREKSNDAEMVEIGSSAPKHAPTLKKMQRAWMSYRDTRCTYMAAQWDGGTGAGPATLDCHLQVTGRQALFLQQMYNY